MNAQERLAVDFVALAGLLLAANPLVTGVAMHEWVALLLVAPLLVHLVVNWDWVARTVGALLKSAGVMPRVNFAVDAALLVAAVAVTLSGVLVVPGWASAVGLPANPIWHAVHLIASDALIGLTLLHFTLHARWVARALGRLASDLDTAVQPTPAASRTLASASRAPAAPVHAAALRR